MARSAVWTGVAAIGLASALVGPAEAATIVHALTISGQASGGGGPFGCATSGPLPSTNFHGGGVPVPAEGHAACNLKGGVQDASKASGLSIAHSTVTNPLNGGVNTASADAKADEGVLGAQASESYTSSYVDSRTYLYSEAGAIWSDPLDYSGLGSGMAYMRWRFDIDGLMSVTGSGDALTRLRYQVGAEPIYTAFVAELGRSFSTPRVISGVTGATLGGFTVAPNSISGADSVFTFFHLVDLDNLIDFKAGLYTAAYSGANSAVVNDFFNTAKLSGIELFDLRGNPLDVSFIGASGTFYDETGAHRATAVPEPSLWALMILGFGLVGLMARHPRRNLRPRRAAADRQLTA
jgi:hypothetical protein